MTLPERRFSLLGTDGGARRGRFVARHGVFETPQFMPVGTRGSVKGVDAVRLKEVGAQIILVNTYHLWLRPGPERVRELGGIQRFTGWGGPILSDSGGFQVFSLKGIRTVAEEGVHFRSHIDGAACFLSPERAIEIQETLGVDIAMALDECPAGGLPVDEVARSLEMTLRWAKRCLDARRDTRTAVFGITQGGTSRDLRSRSASELARLPFDGYAVGGLSVGEPKERMYEVLSYHPEQLPQHAIRYLMGVGTPQDIVQAVKCGIDLFDCVMPTRAGRFGRAFVTEAAKGGAPYLNIRNAQFAASDDSLDPSCECLACRTYSRGYIHHLYRVEEMLGPVLLSIHNLSHYLTLMGRIRVAIEQRQFASLYDKEMKRWKDVPHSEQEEMT